MSVMPAKQCENCSSAFWADGLSRPILICNNKHRCEGKYFVICPKDYCRNFQPSRKISRPQKAPLPDSSAVKFIPLTQGKFAIVDAEDYDRLAKYKWYCHRSRNKFYAYRNKKRKAISMHREVIKAPKGLLVDHIDGNSLNNRKSNLRLCTYAQNAHNRQPKSESRSRYKGLSWHTRNKKWHVSIIKSGRKIFMGCFADQIEAALAYDRKAQKLFGEFAYLNFPELAEFRKHLRKIIYPA